MSTMISEIYEAFTAAGVSKKQARQAAEALTDYDDKFEKLDRRMNILEQKIIKLQGEMTLVKWMLGFNLAISSAILVKLVMP